MIAVKFKKNVSEIKTSVVPYWIGSVFTASKDCVAIMGWVKVEINYNEWTEIDYWLEKNCKNEYKRNRHTIIFEDVQDANWCKLRWL